MMLLSPTSDNNGSGGSGGSGSVLVDDFKQGHHHHDDDAEDEIAISLSGKTAGKTITPFLAKHIPNTYNPMNQQSTAAGSGQGAGTSEPEPSSNTKFCNRHRPDRKCRRQADGPSMEQLQTELSSLSHSDRSAISVSFLSVSSVHCTWGIATLATLRTLLSGMNPILTAYCRRSQHVWSVFSAAPSKQRELILQGILSVACFNQLSFISAQVRDLIKIDFISLLPVEISLQILSKLDTVSLCKSAQVSRTWRQLADDDEVWHNLCTQHLGSRCRKCGWGLPLLEKQRLREWKRTQMQHHNAEEQHQGQQSVLDTEVPTQHEHGHMLSPASLKRTRSEQEESEPDQKRRCKTTPEREEAASNTTLARRPWKDVYKDRFKVGNNWKHGRHQLKIIKHHTNGVTCLQEGSNVLGDHVLAAGSYDCTVTMHDIESGKLLKTFKGATEGIRCLQFNNRQLITGSLDGKVRLYDVETAQLKKTLDGPTGGVLAVHNDANYLAAGSQDKMIVSNLVAFVARCEILMKANTFRSMSGTSTRVV
jgi:F-box/WD-40 domain protein MET30